MRELPKFGELTFEVRSRPISLHHRGPRRAEFVRKVKAAAGQYDSLLSGDIGFNLVWMLREDVRYEDPRAPDLDNTIKVLVDALAGPQGLFINDQQIQHLEASWIDWTEDWERLDVTITFQPDECLLKDGLRFVRLRNGLCFPLNANSPPRLTVRIIDRLNTIIRTGETHKNLPALKRMMPMQRFFHVAHLTGFKIVDYRALRREEALRCDQAQRARKG